MRIRVADVLDLFAAGLSADEILEDLPDLEADDLRASLAYAVRKLNHPVRSHDNPLELTPTSHPRSPSTGL